MKESEKWDSKRWRSGLQGVGKEIGREGLILYKYTPVSCNWDKKNWIRKRAPLGGANIKKYAGQS